MKSNGSTAMLDLTQQLNGLDFLATDLRFAWSNTSDYLAAKVVGPPGQGR